MGFEYFYGFMGGETDQWTPYLYQNTTPIFPWIGKKGYNLTTDLADEAIKYLHGLNAAAPDKPFFLYYVPGGTHSPHQPTKEWIDKVHEMHLFDHGYEKLRETIFANQKRLGVIPAETQLTPWPDGQAAYGGAKLPRWDSLSLIQKKLYTPRRKFLAPMSPTPTMKLAGSSRRFRTKANSTTRSSSTSAATTAPAPKVPRRAPTTK